MKDILYVSGKMLELSAMMLVAFGLFVGLSQEHGMGRELSLLIAGSGIFYAGRLMERHAGGGDGA